MNHTLLILTTKPKRIAGQSKWVCRWKCSCDDEYVHTSMAEMTPRTARMLARIDHNLHISRMSWADSEPVKIDEKYGDIF